MATPTSIKVYAYVTAGWTDISADVTDTIKLDWGIMGETPKDRVADTGSMRFTLLNDNGKYTPIEWGATVLEGWKMGISLKLEIAYDGDTYIKFLGTLEDIRYEIVNPSLILAHVTVVDWMNYAGEHPILTPAMQVDKTADEGIDLVLDSMPVQPVETAFDTGVNTFPNIFDVTRSKTVAMSEFAKLVDSELGFLYLQKNQSTGERLVFENAYHRSGLLPFTGVSVPSSQLVELLQEDGDTLLQEDGDTILVSETTQVPLVSSDNVFFNSVNIEHGQGIANRVKVKIYPRRLDTSTVILYTLGSAREIGNGEEITFTANYVDPVGGSRVGGFDMISPVITTDYLLNTLEDGTGTNLSTDATVTATFGGNYAEVTVKNGSSSNGYITFFQLRGKGIYTYDEAAHVAEDEASISAYGYRELYFDQKYTGTLSNAIITMKSILHQDRQPRNRLNSITFLATHTANTMLAFLGLDIGSLIEVEETIIGISGAFFIQNISVEIEKTGVIYVTYGLVEHWSYLTSTMVPIVASFGAIGVLSAINYGYLSQVVQTGERTYAAWGYRNTDGVYGFIICGPFADGGGTFLEISSANRPIFYSNLFNATPGDWRGTNTNTFMAGDWHHIAVTYNAWSSTDDPIIYIDGASIGVTEFGTPSGTLNSEFGAEVVLGNWHTATQNYTTPFDGFLKDVRIYNRILTAAEVTTLYNAGTPDVSLVTDGLVFQGPSAPINVGLWTGAEAWDIVTIGTTYHDYFLENIYGSVGKMIGTLISP